MAKPSIYVWSVVAAGCAVLLFAVGTLVHWPAPPAALALAALAVVSGISVLRLRSVSASFSIGDAFTLSALFLYGPDVATVSVALDTLAISSRLGGVPKRILFNTAAPCLAMWVTGTAIFGVAGMPLPSQSPDLGTLALSCALAVGIFFLLESGLVAAAVAFHENKSVFVVWRDHFAGLWPSPVAGGYLGALVALFSQSAGSVALVALLPIPMILYHSFRTSVARTDDKLRHLEEVNRMYQSTIEAFATAVDAKDQVTHGHILRVQRYSTALAKELGVADEETLKALEAAALLHDVGKIGIPEHILNKPGRLTPLEYEEMKRHATLGADILSTVEFPFPVVPIVRHHHENWDGTGYPDGLLGRDIPVGARILMVVDCFDALTSERPYRTAMSTEDALEILRARRGTMYDPTVVDAFIKMQPGLAPAHAERDPGEPRPAPVGREAVPSRHPLAAPGAPEPLLHAAAAEPLARLLSQLLPECLSVVYAPEPGGRAVVACAAAGEGARSVVGHRIVFGHGVSGWVAANARAIEDTDAMLDLVGVAPASELTDASCTSVPLTLPGGDLVMTVYGPRAAANARASVVRSTARFIEQISGQVAPRSAVSACDLKVHTTVQV